MTKPEDRRYVTCEVCQRVWNISRQAHIRQYGYICPTCQAFYRRLREAASAEHHKKA